MAKEYVIRGNDALMTCSIPSFVADVVQVIAWLRYVLKDEFLSKYQQITQMAF